MKKLKPITIDLEMIIQSMRDLCRESTDYYLDKTSGKVFAISRALLCSFEHSGRDNEEDLPAWDAQMIPIAREIVLKGSENFVRIPEAFGQPEHNWMMDFAEDLRPVKLKERVIKGMKGRGACSRFKENLADHPDDLNRWSVYSRKCWYEKIQNWLTSIGILGVEAKIGKKITHPR